MSWFGWVMLVLAGTILLFRLHLYLQSKRLEGKAAPALEAAGREGLQTAGPTLIYFHSPQCGPCKKMTPLIEELVASHENVVSVDVSRELETARKYQIRAVPTTVLVRDGRVQKVLLGFQSLKRLNGLLSAGS